MYRIGVEIVEAWLITFENGPRRARSRWYSTMKSEGPGKDKRKM
jgi:hypothetical protein